MMDVEKVRSHMDDVKTRLRKVEQEVAVLMTLLRTYEGWLQLLEPDYSPPSDGQTAVTDQQIVAEISPRHSSSSRKGYTLREAVQKVLQDANGEPLSAKDIWLRVQSFGIGTNLKEPPAVLDYTSCTLKGVQKVGARTWRWVGDEDSDEDGPSVAC